MRLSWKLPVDHLSASSMTMFSQCPEQFRRKHLLKEPEKSFGPRFIGSVDHQVNARIMSDRMNEPSFAAEAIKAPLYYEQVYREVWDEVLERDGEPDWKGDDPVAMFKRGVLMAKTYQTQVDVKPVAIESRFDFTVEGVPVPIYGYIDVCEADKIRERKTSAAKKTKPKAAWRFQGLVYQYATGLPVQWDIVTRQVTPQVYTADLFPDLYLPMTDTTKTKVMIQEVVARMNDLYARHGRVEPWPMEGIFSDYLCDWCGHGPKYKADCLAWSA